MRIEFKNISEGKYYDILLTTLVDLVHADSRRRHVLQDRMLLFCLLNGYIEKKQFLILCQKTELYGGKRNSDEKLAQSYARRFFSEKCIQGVLQRKERKNGESGQRNTVYTAGARGRERLRQTLPLCGVSFSFSVNDILDALNGYYPMRNQWREPAHYLHMLGIGDFFAAMACMNGCYRFEKEISIANGAGKAMKRNSQIICKSLSVQFRADAYAELEQGVTDTIKGHMQEKNGYAEISCQGRIKILYEQDTGSQRKNILASKLENYSGIFRAFLGQCEKEEAVLCLLFSCQGSTNKKQRLSENELFEGEKEAEYISSLRYGNLEEQELEGGETDTFFKSKDILSALMRQTGMSAVALKSIYGAIQGLSGILGIKSPSELLFALEQPKMAGGLGEKTLNGWTGFLKLMMQYGNDDDIDAYEEVFYNGTKGMQEREEMVGGERYALYHHHMADFLKRREAIQRGMERNSSLLEAALLGNMVASVPSAQMPLLLPFLFPGSEDFCKQWKNYMNFMHFGISTIRSFQIYHKDRHGVLRNFFFVDTFSGTRRFNIENMSLDMTASIRLAFYLKRYAGHIEEYENGHILIVFFLSDDLPRVREFALDMGLYLPYENGLLNERFFVQEKNTLEVLFVCMEDMLDKRRQMPAITFDRKGNGHYKIFSSSNGPKFFDIPADRPRAGVLVEVHV